MTYITLTMLLVTQINPGWQCTIVIISGCLISIILLHGNCENITTFPSDSTLHFNFLRFFREHFSGDKLIFESSENVPIFPVLQIISLLDIDIRINTDFCYYCLFSFHHLKDSVSLPSGFCCFWGEVIYHLYVPLYVTWLDIFLLTTFKLLLYLWFKRLSMMCILFVCRLPGVHWAS